MRILSALLLFLVTTAFAAAADEKRFALVVGQSAYLSVSPLPNPSKDAIAVADALEKTGFKVIRSTDRSLAALKGDIDTFVKNLQQAGPGATALFFYGGHGVQRDGVNYLLPIDAKIAKDEDVPKQAIALSDILKRLDGTGATTKIVVLDACRDNPFAAVAGDMARGLAVVLTDTSAPQAKGESGLARIEAKSGTFVAFSTSPGTTASDGSGDHSPFASALLSLIPEPGVPVEQVFKRVRNAVHDATRGEQTPWETSSLTANFVFVPGTALAETPAAAKLFSSTRPTRTVMVDMGAEEAYKLAVVWDTPEIYRLFVDVYPGDTRTLSVHRSLSVRQQELSWAEAVLENSAEGYAAFLRLYPDSSHTIEARRLQLGSPHRNLQSASVCLPGQNNPNVPKLPLQKRTEKPAKRTIEKPIKVVKQRPPRRRVIEEEVEDAPRPVRRRPPAVEVVEDAPPARRRPPPGEFVDSFGGSGLGNSGVSISIGGFGGGRRTRMPSSSGSSMPSHTQ